MTTDAQPAPEPGSPQKSRTVFIALGVGGAILFCVFIAVFGSVIFGTLGGGSQIVVAFPNRDAEADVYLLEPGQDPEKGSQVSENLPVSNQIFIGHFDKDNQVRVASGDYASFIPASDDLLYWYSDDGDAVLMSLEKGGKEGTEVISTNATSVVAVTSAGSDYILIVEILDDQARCYAGKPGEEATRLAKGDGCSISDNFSKVYAWEVDGDQTTVTTIGLNGKNETVLLDEAEGVVAGAMQFSPDASRLAFVKDTGEGQQVYWVEEGQEPLAVGAEFPGVIEFGFIPGSDGLYFIVENEEGTLELYTSESETLVAAGVQIAAAFDKDGNYLIYQTMDEDGEAAIFTRKINSDTSQEILTGEGLTFSLSATNPPKIVIQAVDGDEYTVYTADLDGKNLVEVFSENNLAGTIIRHLQGGDQLFISYKLAGGEWSFFVTPAGKADGFVALDEWAAFDLFNISANGKTLLFEGRESAGDDPILYSLALEADASPVELDDDNEGILNAVFSENGRDVLYTASTGSAADDYEIRLAPANGEEKPAVLYEEAQLEDVQWHTFKPFLNTQWTALREGTSFCPGAPSIQVGDALETQISASDPQCYRFRASAAALLTFSVEQPGPDTYLFGMDIFDREGNRLAESGAKIPFFAAEAGVYFLMVSTGSSAEIPYTLHSLEAPLDPLAADAERLEPGARVRGAITEAAVFALLHNTSYSGYGNYYYFDGQQGETFTLNLFASSLGSNMAASLIVLDVSFEILYNSSRATEEADASLSFTLPRTSRYFVIVTDTHNNFGTAENFFYEIELTREE